MRPTAPSQSVRPIACPKASAVARIWAEAGASGPGRQPVASDESEYMDRQAGADRQTGSLEKKI